MSGGFWFAVCIPTEEYEKSLYAVYSDKEDEQKGENGEKEIDVEKGEKKEEVEDKQETNGNIYASLSDIRKQKEKKKEVTVMFVDETSDSPEGTDKTEQSSEDDETLVKLLKDALELLGIEDSVWTTGEDKNYHQIYFPCEPGVRCDYVLATLAERGIGMRGRSTLGVIPCAVFYRDTEGEDRPPEYEEKESDSEESTVQKSTKTDIKKAFKGFRSLQRQFLKSVRARLTVAQVVEGVRANAMLTFDFMMFTVLASMIAALGLIENSSVILVASMLISPLMGPILAGTFGAVIQDKPLRNLGIKTEIAGLVLCLVFGFLFGLICGNFSEQWGQGKWPTTEMASRGQGRSLWVGVLIALPSGAGVALSVLGGNAGSLVGVAISASLLPPAVNAGLLWALSAVKVQKSMTEFPLPVYVNNETKLLKPSLIPPAEYEIAYYDSMDKECAVLGVVSLLLTLVNILCIFLMAVLVLKIKEVAPTTAASQTSRFWKQDIKIARDYNKTYSTSEGRELGKDFLDEWARLSGISPDVYSTDPHARMSQYSALRNIYQDVELDPVYQTVARFMPTSRPLSQRLSTIPEGNGRRTTWGTEMRTDPSYAMTVAAPSLRRHTHLAFENGDKQKTKKAKTQAPSALSSRTVIDVTTDPDFKGIQLRRPPTQKNNRLSEFLRQSLWPSSSAPRFQVTPVTEGQTAPVQHPPPQRIRRGSLDANIQKESNC